MAKWLVDLNPNQLFDCSAGFILQNEVVMKVLRITIILLAIALIMGLAAVAVGYLR